MLLGIRYILLSGLSFIFVNFLVKLLSGNSEASEYFHFESYGAHELVFFRSLVSFAISAFVIKKKKIPFFGNNKPWLFVRGIAGVIALTIFFFTLQNLPLAVASILQYLSPIFTVILAALILKEKIFKLQWILILLAFCGVILIAFENFLPESGVQINPLWMILGIVSAFFSAIAYVAIVKLKNTDKPITIVLYFPMLALPFTGIWCLFDFVTPVAWEWLVLLLIGVFTQIAQILMTKALHTADTAKIVPFQYLGAIYAILIGWFVFDERLNGIPIIGMFIIIICVILNTLYQHKMKSNA
jgi:drug/metabolite transporter (DMT)-like permease|tara:strand:+ start:8962 stop:9861 length:900 start_codon:yes stop_codon:yes gene_type:complete